MTATAVEDRLRDRLTELSGDGAPAPRSTAAEMIRAARQANVSEPTLLRAVAGALGIAYVESLAAYATSADFVADVPISFARRHGVLGLIAPDEDGRITIAVGGVEHLRQVEILSRFLGRPATPILAPAAVVAAAINAAYQQRTGQAQEVIDRLDATDRDDVLRAVRAMDGREDLLDVAARAPVIKLVNLILFEAARADASDVHVQPYEDHLAIRTRIDGVLYDTFSLPRSVQDEVISRLKVMGRMNIAEKRLAQDGRATVQIGDRVIDLRIASLPTSFGERVVVRLLDKSSRLYELHEIGMDPLTLARFQRLLAAEHGLVLVTGPTGSGKTTTLYSALGRINTAEKNVLTLEDPIEYQLTGVSQTQVSERKGMTFASGLRNVLRQDPDVIMVGEIRDRETATMAIQSSLTGHLVFSTLHTNDAASAVTRLLDLGIEPYLVASSLVGVLAQRLVRRVCPRCAAPRVPDEPELRWLGVARDAAAQMRRGGGCDACRRTGYRGRVGAFELIVIDEALRALIQSRATASEVKAAAVRAGTRTLRDDGIAKVLAGMTTVSEVERVTAEPGQDVEPIVDASIDPSP